MGVWSLVVLKVFPDPSKAISGVGCVQALEGLRDSGQGIWAVLARMMTPVPLSSLSVASVECWYI